MNKQVNISTGLILGVILGLAGLIFSLKMQDFYLQTQAVSLKSFWAIPLLRQVQPLNNYN